MALTFPNVPDVPGVPPLGRNPQLPFINSNSSSVGNDAISTFGRSPQSQWGLFMNGAAVITAETVAAIEYRQDWDVSNYPLEQGAFETYNKVNSPFDARIRFVTGESEQARSEMLASVEKAGNSLDLYDLVMPEKVFTSVNVVHYDFSRKAYSGLGLLTLDVWVLEVRISATAKFSNTKSPSGADAINGGQVQAQQPTPAETQSAQLLFDARRRESDLVH